MSEHIKLGVALVATALAVTAAGGAIAKPAMTDKARIEALESNFASAVGAKDVGRIMAAYSKDSLFVFDVSPPRQHVGWDDYKKDWDSFVTGVPGPVKFTLSDLDVTVVGVVAYGHSVQDMRWTNKDGSPGALTVRVTDVYRKSASGWAIVQEHVSVPVDLDTDKPDLLSKP
jgi:ketosteroid isomerase-like protein